MKCECKQQSCPCIHFSLILIHTQVGKTPQCDLDWNILLSDFLFVTFGTKAKEDSYCLLLYERKELLNSYSPHFSHVNLHTSIPESQLHTESCLPFFFFPVDWPCVRYKSCLLALFPFAGRYAVWILLLAYECKSHIDVDISLNNVPPECNCIYGNTISSRNCTRHRK